MNPVNYKPLFPYFGEKSKVAPIVWKALGNPNNYVEPFFGSGAVLFMRPDGAGPIETVNDADGLLCNFWRAVKVAPEVVAEHADWPVNECDLHARHAWLVGQRASITEALIADPDFYDAKIAGWWVWGICCWIGGGWCDGNAHRKRPNLGGAGRGVHRQLPHLGDAGMGVHRKRENVRALMQWFAERLRYVRVCCGDWSRVCGPTPTIKNGLTGVFLDPPYSAEAGRASELYAVESLTVAHAVREWAIEWGTHPKMRIVVAGYEGEHAFPEGWTVHEWKARGGYGVQGNGAGRDNAMRERLWLSPHCLSVEGVKQMTLEMV